MNINRIQATIILTFCLTCLIHAGTIYVGPKGKDDNPGSKELPLRSIQEAVERCEAGDECVVLTGRYCESVKIKSGGEKGKPIVIRAEGEVILDGTDSLDGTWEKYRENTLRIKLPGPAVEQAFLNDIPLSPARWPNARFEDTWIRSKWAQAAEGSHKDLMVCDALAESGIDWSGAIAVLNVGHQYKTWTRKILSHEKGGRSFTYELAERLGDGRDDGGTWWNDRFYITGTLKALDAPGEFFHDTESGCFYLATADGKPPAAGSIRIKRRDFGITGSKISDIHIRNFKFFGCTVKLDDASDTIIEDCEIRFPAYTMLIGETMPPKERFNTPCTSVHGNNNTVKGLYVAYACGDGIVAAGTSNRVENCIVHDACWSGTINFAGITVKPYKQGATESTVSRCTVYNTGNVGIYYRGGCNIIEYNLVHHTGLACHDIAAIHTGSPAAAGSIARYNWIHHSMGLAMRGDDQTRELTVHHNLVWNCDQGIIVKGDRNKVYNNTILGSGGHGCLTIPTREEPKKWWTPNPILPVQNANSLFFNNYCEDISYRHDPLPQNPGILHNISYKDNIPYTNSLVNADAAALESGNPDARPKKGASIIDAGIELDGITADHTGRAPDAGAYEYGQPLWRAGATCKEPMDIVLPIEAEVARSWDLATERERSIPLPLNFRESQLLERGFKEKLQKIYDACWTKEEIERRKTAIHKRGEKGSPEYEVHHKVVAELHIAVYQRFVKKAPTILSGEELELFNAAAGLKPENREK